MGDVTRVLSGLEDSEVTGVVKAPGGGLEVSVRLAASMRRVRAVGPSARGSRSIAARPNSPATAAEGRRRSALGGQRPTSLGLRPRCTR